ncbi:helix-turn-helix domain-containing protein [Actinocrinis puniceicyclus]|uniref:Helix-turn-helix domain-containing protein n=1 Tax=Actinocrinis puniceicyclus TaxID=977794 RepID=A0A8J8BCX6_9ACTN|nr:helix-turn-helix transcriptional regulator [Actinocrinis puniceicyclus]MBS2964658.1 helix-turn-helix domain-containing protein [Actinocrinis puniceicyclus]
MATFDEQSGVPPTGPTVRRLILGTQLRRLRERAEITRAEAAYSIRGSESKLSRMESGRVGFKERDVADLLTLYGVTEQAERAKVLDLVAQSNVQGWWHAYSDLMPKWFEDYIGLEESASQIKVYELQFVPGLLQTRDYALSILSRGRPENADVDAERKLRLRMQRQKVLLGQNAPRLWTVIDESVLYRRLGGARVLRAQLDHLLEVTTLANISLQVVPYHTSGYGAEGPFTLLRFGEPELSDIVYVEHLAGALYLEKPEEIEIYSRALDRLAVEAETPARSRQILLKAREEI